MGYAMLMSPNKGKTAVHGRHCLGDTAVHALGTGHTAELCSVTIAFRWVIMGYAGMPCCEGYGFQAV